MTCRQTEATLAAGYIPNGNSSGPDRPNRVWCGKCMEGYQTPASSGKMDAETQPAMRAK
jgi:hypothetical protein